MYKIPCENPEARSREVAISRGYTGTTIYAYDIIDGHLKVKDGDFNGLTMAEIQSATPYTPKEERI